jgi:hypothetical protein
MHLRPDPVHIFGPDQPAHPEALRRIAAAVIALVRRDRYETHGFVENVGEIGRHADDERRHRVGRVEARVVDRTGVGHIEKALAAGQHRCRREDGYPDRWNFGHG